jgi:hypothetical protein
VLTDTKSRVSANFFSPTLANFLGCLPFITMGTLLITMGALLINYSFFSLFLYLKYSIHRGIFMKKITYCFE